MRPLKPGMDSAEELRGYLRSEGYTQQTPRAETAELDAMVAEKLPCPNCGARMLYEPWIHEGRYPEGGYRALAVCSTCAHGQEF